MASIDKAAIAFSIAITAIGAGFAFVGDSVDYSTTVSTPTVSKTVEKVVVEETQKDPFADIAAKVKENPEKVMKEVAEEVVEEAEDIIEEAEEVVEEIGDVIIEETEKRSPGPQTFTVDMPAGTSVPGCEETNECYLPADIIIFAGDTVEWVNVDTAAHTVTGGSPADGPSGVFDSSLVMGGASYSFTFNDSGSYDYFCMVHPWMVGNVQVN